MANENLIKKAQHAIAAAESHLFIKPGAPRGSYNTLADGIRKLAVSRGVITANQLLKEVRGRTQDEYSRVFYLARDVVGLTSPSQDNFAFDQADAPEEIRAQIRQIATAGRRLSLRVPWLTRSRINNGQLFKVLNDIYAANIPDSRRGCSASICSNCSEPVAYCYQNCPCCKNQFVGPFTDFGWLPEIAAWRTLDIESKQYTINETFKRKNHGRLEVAPATWNGYS